MLTGTLILSTSWQGLGCSESRRRRPDPFPLAAPIWQLVISVTPAFHLEDFAECLAFWEPETETDERAADVAVVDVGDLAAADVDVVDDDVELRDSKTNAETGTDGAA